ncbi:MAG: XdhC family protein, partial [Pseudomonas chlororaphis]
MDSVDLNVLRSVLEWRRAGQRVTLYSVVQTWGSAPRPPGAMLALREDGMVIGSVSGGCIEDDLIARLHDGRLPLDGPPVQLMTYGVTREEAARFGLPCGGTLRLTEERVGDPAWVAELLARCEAHEIVARELNLSSGEVLLKPASKTDVLSFDDTTLRAIYGPRWRLLLIGAGQLSRYVAEMARLLDFEVLICDPRKEFVYGWEEQHGRFVPGMPDDAVLNIETDERTAIVALTHDP